MEQTESIEAMLRLSPQIVVAYRKPELDSQNDGIYAPRPTKDRLYDRPEQTSTTHPADSSVGAVKKICRICLDQQGTFVAPCVCSGSIRYIHYHCLEEWLLKSFSSRMSYADFKKSKCEVCSTRYNFKCSRQRHFQCEVLYANYHYYRATYLQFVVGVSLLAMVTIALMALLGVINNNPAVNGFIRAALALPPDNNLNIILGAVVFVLTGALAVIIGIFLIEFGLKSVVSIISIENHATIKSKPCKTKSLRTSVRAQII